MCDMQPNNKESPFRTTAVKSSMYCVKLCETSLFMMDCATPSCVYWQRSFELCLKRWLLLWTRVRTMCGF